MESVHFWYKNIYIPSVSMILMSDRNTGKEKKAVKQQIDN